MTTPIIVSSLDALYAALAAADGGETILLRGGDYGSLELSARSGFTIDFPSNVTIASVDPDNPARFSTAAVNGVSNLTLDGITFDYGFTAGDAIYYRPFNFNGVENVTIRNSTFNGDVAEGVSDFDDGYGYAIGLSVRGSTGVSIENNEFFGFHRGMVLSESRDILVSQNDLHDLRMDGMNLSEVQGILIEENYIHDFHGAPDSADHSDMIQFWTNGTDAPSTDITIRGNYLDIGAGDYTQSIFMRNELVDRGTAGDEMFYRDILIEDNVIINAHLHGIAVGETDGLVIRNNSVLHADGGSADGLDNSVEIPRISVSGDARDVTITNNATNAVAGWDGQAGWIVADNALVQDQDATAPGYYGDVFIASSLALRDGVHSFVARPDGLLSTLMAGAPETLTPTGVPGLSLAFAVDTLSAAERVFDAAYSSLDMGALPEGSTLLWDFGDGTSQSGSLVSHSYATGGIYTVTLTVATTSGDRAALTLDVPIAGAEVLSFEQGIGFAAFDTGTASGLAIAGAQDAAGLDLGASGTVAEVARAHVTDIIGVDDFTIGLSLASDTIGASGEVMRLHGSFILSVADGELVLRTFGANGAQPVLKTAGANLSDMASHDISICFSGGQFDISVDGAVLATGPGIPLAGLVSHSLTFGNPWGSANFDGHLTALDITANAEDYPQAPLEVPSAQAEGAGLDPVHSVSAPSVRTAVEICISDDPEKAGTGESGTDYLVDRLSVTEGADVSPVAPTPE